ncbi:SpoIIE family protein phosphatase, partial [bacterium]|nr:SpoIIE family protein phosphatase [bacterium]
GQLAAWSDPAAELDAEGFALRMRRLDEHWLTATVADPEVAATVEVPLAEALRSFQRLNPSYREILVTDKRGQLVAATNKTSDYWQGDEEWWQRTHRVRAGRAYLEGIHYDESAQVYSLDLCIPIIARDRPQDPIVGVLKAVVDPTPAFAALKPILREFEVRRHLVLDDGQVVYRLLGEPVTPYTLQFSAAAVARINPHEEGWAVVPLLGDRPRLVGYAPLDLGGPVIERFRVPGQTPGWHRLYVEVDADARTVLAPVRRQLIVVAGMGILLLLLFTWTGYYVAQRMIVTPIQRLQSAVSAVAESGRLEAVAAEADAVPPASTAGRVLAELDRVRTGDELEDLAREFRLMAIRVLRYHEHLEAEISRQTRAIQQDLQFAREFQEALLPHQYPEVPTPPADGMVLRFHHVYQPASTVGGDFFDVLKLDDHRAGIFIADVMGHGARSALVTAMLRTLLYDLSHQADDPARFLGLINENFHQLVNHSGQFLFVSAFYLVIDTAKGLATYASAGHPSPYLAERSSRRAHRLIEGLHNNPALGLFPDSQYTNFTSFPGPHDVFLLFTDGLFEALNPAGEEFGVDRLRSVIEANLDRDVAGLCQTVIDTMSQFTEGTPLNDDVCLVAVEVGDVRPAAAAPADAVAAAS